MSTTTDLLLQFSQPFTLLVRAPECGDHVDRWPAHHERLVRCARCLCYVVDAGGCPHVTYVDTLLQTEHIARPTTKRTAQVAILQQMNIAIVTVQQTYSLSCDKAVNIQLILSQGSKHAVLIGILQ